MSEDVQADTQDDVAEDQTKEAETPVKGKTKQPKTKPVSKPKATSRPVLSDDEPPFNGATDYQLSDAAEYLHLAGDVTRMKILALSNGERSVSDMTREVDTTQPALSHHITLLKGARLISRNREGKVNRYSVTKVGKAVLKAVKTVVAACGKNGDDED